LARHGPSGINTTYVCSFSSLFSPKLTSLFMRFSLVFFYSSSQTQLEQNPSLHYLPLINHLPCLLPLLSLALSLGPARFPCLNPDNDQHPSKSRQCSVNLPSTPRRTA
jgi:hypothetical protein